MAVIGANPLRQAHFIDYMAGFLEEQFGQDLELVNAARWPTVVL